MAFQLHKIPFLLYWHRFVEQDFLHWHLINLCAEVPAVKVAAVCRVILFSWLTSSTLIKGSFKTANSDLLYILVKIPYLVPNL